MRDPKMVQSAEIVADTTRMSGDDYLTYANQHLASKTKLDAVTWLMEQLVRERERLQSLLSAPLTFDAIGGRLAAVEVLFERLMVLGDKMKNVGAVEIVNLKRLRDMPDGD